MSNDRNVGRIPETGVMTAYERWELPSLDEQDEAANEVEIEPVTAEEVDQIRSEAYDNGFSEGQKTGYQEGFDKGEKDGHQKGYAEGQQTGHTAGLNQGKQDGLTQGQAEINSQISRLSELMAQFDDPQAALNADLQESLLNVVAAVSRTVVHRELQTDTSQVRDLLKRGLEQMDSSKDQLQVLVNPADLIYIEQAAEEAGATWKIQADDSIMPGGLKLKSGPSLVDLTAEHRFQQAILNLLGRTDWAVDLASGHSSEQQDALTSLSEGFDVPSETIEQTEEVSELEPESLPEQSNDLLSDTSEAESINSEPVEEESSESIAQEAAEVDETISEQLEDDSAGIVDNSETDLQPQTVEEVASGEQSAASEDVEDTQAESIQEAPIPVASDEESVHAESSQNEQFQEEANQEKVSQEELNQKESGLEASSSEAPSQEALSQEGQSQVESDQTECLELDSGEALLDNSDDHISAHSMREEFTAEDEMNLEDLLTHEEKSALSEDVFDFEVDEQDENTTVYPENQKVSDLIAQEEIAESDELVQANTQQSGVNQVNNDQLSNEQVTNSPEVQSMMNPAPQGNGFQAFGWQAPQAQQAQAHAQQAQMQANAASAEAQQAQARAQQAQAQAQQAQAHAQAMNQQAMNQQMVNQQAAQGYQPQYAPQQGGYSGQPGMPMQPAAPQGYVQPGMQQPAMPQAGYQQPVMQGNVPQNAPAQGGWGMQQGMMVQPVPMVPAQQGNFSAFNFSGSPQGGQQQPAGFMPYQYPLA